MDSVRLLWSLLDRAAKRRFVLLLLLTTIAGFVEILSVGLVIPFIALASGSLPFGKAFIITQTLTDLLAYLHVPVNWTIAALGIIFLLGVILANLYLCAYQFYAAIVVQRQKYEFSMQIVRNLSGHSLEWLDQENSSDLVKIALSDVHNVCGFINAVTQICAVLTRTLVVYLFFLVTQFRLAISLAIAAVILYQAVDRFIQRPVRKAGETAQAANAQMFRSAQELIGGARAARSTSTEKRFYDRFQRSAHDSVFPQVLRTMPGYLTRSGLEVATVSLVVAVLVYFNFKDGNLANGLPLLSSYAVAGIRLLPALQQGLAYAVDMRFYEPSLKDVARLLKDVPETPMADSAPDRLSLNNCLELRDVCYSYNSDRPVLQNVSLRIDKNSRVAFVGETGAGKSTLIDIVLALRLPQTGSMVVDGVTEISASTASAWRTDLGYVPQSVYLLDASIAENVAFGLRRSEVDEARLKRACDAASLSDFIETLPNKYETFVGERGVRLSGGQCQRIGIARALYHDPEVVIFDEATSALDSQTESSVLEALDRLKGAKTLIVIAHRLNTVWDFDKIFVLHKGRLVGQGTSKELLANCPDFQRLAQHQLESRSDLVSNGQALLAQGPISPI